MQCHFHGYPADIGMNAERIHGLFKARIRNSQYNNIFTKPAKTTVPGPVRNCVLRSTLHSGDTDRQIADIIITWPVLHVAISFQLTTHSLPGYNYLIPVLSSTGSRHLHNESDGLNKSAPERSRNDPFTAEPGTHDCLR